MYICIVRKHKSYILQDRFYEHFIAWLNNFPVSTAFDSLDYYKLENNPRHVAYHTFDKIIAVGFVSELIVHNQDSFESLKQYQHRVHDWIFGYLSYDLKNELEELSSENIDLLKFPNIYFFQPKYIFIFQEHSFDVYYLHETFAESDIDHLVEDINNFPIPDKRIQQTMKINSRFSKQEYLATVERLIEHIKLGDIYEVNFCQEFFANTTINPIEIFQKLVSVSPMPFSCFFKLYDKYLMCASPERYVKKIENKIISQPIKGTAHKGINVQEDQKIMNELIESEKERAENIMVVDLVRNDLSRTAAKSSVKVEELCGVYTFRQVHHLISTIVSKLSDDCHFVDILKTTFPMGSMTGTPKISALKLIEKYEKTKRGIYSGSVGYITPEGDFDFNVVIRSMLYNSDTNYLSFSVGGAITALSIPENEYNECLVKAQAILNVLQS